MPSFYQKGKSPTCNIFHLPTYSTIDVFKGALPIGPPILLVLACRPTDITLPLASTHPPRKVRLHVELGKEQVNTNINARFSLAICIANTTPHLLPKLMRTPMSSDLGQRMSDYDSVLTPWRTHIGPWERLRQVGQCV